jgi:hypothetical protein
MSRFPRYWKTGAIAVLLMLAASEHGGAALRAAATPPPQSTMASEDVLSAVLSLGSPIHLRMFRGNPARTGEQPGTGPATTPSRR